MNYSFGGVSLSVDSGATWTPANGNLPSHTDWSNNVWYPHVLSLASINNTLYASTDQGLFYTNNNGTNWTATAYTNEAILFVNDTTLYLAGVSLLATSNNFASVDTILNINVNTLVADSSNFYLASNVGPIFSTNNAATWQYNSKGIINTFVSLASNNSSVYACTNTGNVYEASNTLNSWQKRSLSQCEYGCAPDGLALVDSTMYANCSILRSDDFGATWISKFWLSGESFFANNQYVAFGTEATIYFSTDKGNSWAMRSTFPYTNMYLNHIILDGANWYAASENFGLYLSTDSGQNWVNINSGINFTWINALTVNGNDIYVAGGPNCLYHSSNQGSSWVSIASACPGLVRKIIISGNYLFAASDKNGVLVSGDHGLNWWPVNSGLTNLSVSDLTISGTNIYAATNGSGVFVSSLDSLYQQVGIQQHFINNPKLYPNPAQNNFTVDLIDNTKQQLQIFDLTGKQILQQTITSKTTVDVSSLDNGVYFVLLKNQTGISTQKIVVQH